MNIRVGVILIACFFIILLTSIAQAQEEKYELLWSYDTDYGWVESVSVSSDGSYVAAGGNKVYFFNREGKLLWSYEIIGSIRRVLLSSNGKYATAVADRGTKVYFFRQITPTPTPTPTPPQQNILLQEDFESYASGTFPSSGGWRAYFNAVDDPSHNIVTDSTSYSGSKSLQVYGSHWGCWAALVAHDLPKRDVIYIEAAMKASGEAGGGCHKNDITITLGLRENIVSWGWIDNKKLIIFKSDGKIYGINGVLQNFMPNKWYKIKIRLDSVSGKVTYWIDGNYIATQNVESFDYDTIGFESGDGKGWVDDVKVYYEVSKTGAKVIIEEIKSLISQEKSKGFNVEEAEKLLSQAQTAFSQGEYSKAISLAEKAKSLAIDIDRDGVTNEEDFAPYINNYLIYAGAVVFLISFSIGISAYLKRRRAMKEAYEREKAEIIAMIDEAISSGGGRKELYKR